METTFRTDPSTPDGDWVEAERRLMAAVPAPLRDRVHQHLVDPHVGGRGLRALVGLMVNQGRPLPTLLPTSLVDIYLDDDEAEPLDDCGRCGLPLPVRATRRFGHESAPERVYFTTCPHCGGPAGRHAFWSTAVRAGGVATAGPS